MTVVEAPFEDPDRAREVPATEVGDPKIAQPEGECKGVISRFRGPHGVLGVPDRLVELADLGEHVGEVDLRERRLDGRRPEALEALVALKRDDVALEQGGRFAELAPGGVGHAQEGRRDHLD